jgi:hypothetical protein
MYKNSSTLNNTYLSNLDLINKYNLRSVYSVPSLKIISLTLSLNNIIEACELKNTVTKDYEIQIKSFLLLYLTFLIIPFLKNNKIKLIKTSEKNLQMNYILKVVLINSVDINEFLFLIFIENWQQLLIDENALFKKSSLPSLNSDVFIFRTQVYLNNLLSFQSIFSMLFTNINLKEVPLKISFKIGINKTLNYKDKFKVLKNLPLFWISG